MTKKTKTSTIVCTIILSIMVIISLYLTIGIITINLHASIQAMLDSTTPLDEDVGGEGQLIYYGVVSITASILIILAYLLAGFVVVISIIGIIIGIVNRKTENKGLRYYNYVLLSLMSFTCIASIVKMILWGCGY